MAILTLLLLAASAACGPAELREQMRDLAAPAGGRVGAAAMLVETGERISRNGTERFPMQSVYKIPIAMAVLARVDEGLLHPEQKVRVEEKDLAYGHSPIREKYPHGGVDLTLSELLSAMIVDSDNTACDVLLRIVAPGEVTAFLRALGVNALTVATSEKEMALGEQVQYRNWATPESAVDLLRVLQQGRGLSPASRSALLGWMSETTIGAHRIKEALPPGTPVAHKTGLSRTIDGMTRATNDVGLITLPDGRHLAVAVFVSDSPADESIRDAVIAKIARVAWDCWATPSR